MRFEPFNEPICNKHHSLIYLSFMKMQIRVSLTVALLIAWSLPVSADYTLVLKNGRQITVQSYREEGKMIKFYGLGGEIGLSKDQIQTIRKAGDGERQDLSLPTPPVPSSRPSDVGQPSSDTPQAASKESAGPERTPGEDSVKEDLEQQKRLKEITEQLENAKQRYFTATQGGGTSAGATAAGYRASTADLMSKLKEKRGAADSEYEPQERELRDLRRTIDKLQKERDTLIQEMKAKSSATDSQ